MQMNMFLDNIADYWKSFDIEEVLGHIGLTYSVPVQAALCFGSGFATGFLFKKYFRVVFVGCLLAAVAIAVLDYNQLIVIEWTSIQEFVGMDPNSTMNEMINNSFDWIKENVVVFASCTIGFLLGYQLG